MRHSTHNGPHTSVVLYTYPNIFLWKTLLWIAGFSLWMPPVHQQLHICEIWSLAYSVPLNWLILLPAVLRLWASFIHKMLRKSKKKTFTELRFLLSETSRQKHQIQRWYYAAFQTNRNLWIPTSYYKKYNRMPLTVRVPLMSLGRFHLSQILEKIIVWLHTTMATPMEA